MFELVQEENFLPIELVLLLIYLKMRPHTQSIDIFEDTDINSLGSLVRQQILQRNYSYEKTMRQKYK